jgi:hypothetical protein
MPDIRKRGLYPSIDSLDFICGSDLSVSIADKDFAF